MIILHNAHDNNNRPSALHYTPTRDRGIVVNRCARQINTWRIFATVISPVSDTYIYIYNVIIYTPAVYANLGRVRVQGAGVGIAGHLFSGLQSRRSSSLGV